MYNVYRISNRNNVIYIGYTNDLTRRSKEHNYHLNKGTSKQLYDFLRKKQIRSIKLELLKKFKTRTEAKRFECMLILMYHFAGHSTLQKIPSISDR
jgi:predicted GIY-YIG superfamily endonuclease